MGCQVSVSGVSQFGNTAYTLYSASIWKILTSGTEQFHHCESQGNECEAPGASRPRVAHSMQGLELPSSHLSSICCVQTAKMSAAVLAGSHVCSPAHSKLWYHSASLSSYQRATSHGRWCIRDPKSRRIMWHALASHSPWKQAVWGVLSSKYEHIFVMNCISLNDLWNVLLDFKELLAWLCVGVLPSLPSGEWHSCCALTDISVNLTVRWSISNNQSLSLSFYSKCSACFPPKYTS